MMQAFTPQVNDLHKHFGFAHAADEVNLTVPTGYVMTSLSLNGAEKTTISGMALNLSRPIPNTVWVLGTMFGEAINAGRISAVLQIGGLLGDTRVHETLAWIAAARGGGMDSRENLERVMEQAGTIEIAKRKIRKCSGGGQQRIKFAFTLLSNPDLLILGKPTAGMSTQARHGFWRTTHAQAASGKTITLAIHCLREAQNCAECVVLMNHGKIAADDSPTEITPHQQRAMFFTTSDVVVARIHDHYSKVSLVAIAGRFRVSLMQTGDFVRFTLTVPGVENLGVTQLSLEQTFFNLAEPDSSPNTDA